jgi:hypothetical protein
MGYFGQTSSKDKLTLFTPDIFVAELTCWCLSKKPDMQQGIFLLTCYFKIYHAKITSDDRQISKHEYAFSPGDNSFLPLPDLFSNDNAAEGPFCL